MHVRIIKLTLKHTLDLQKTHEFKTHTWVNMLPFKIKYAPVIT